MNSTPKPSILKKLFPAREPEKMKRTILQTIFAIILLFLLHILPFIDLNHPFWKFCFVGLQIGVGINIVILTLAFISTPESKK